MTIHKLFIANRAEIALRIVRTARRMGIATVVPWHAQDRAGPALAVADDTVELLGDPPVAAWLDGDALIRAAIASGCDALHPGYGFLSENANFARAVTQAGLRFVGPPADVIALMGDKITARQFAQGHGVPVTPSVDAASDPDHFAERAAGIGFPLLIKAAAGGGGKGMHVIHDAAALPQAIDTARAESLRYFGDDRLLAERFIEAPRHIEVQIFGDGHGQWVHLGERECSIQRRFQKLIEESPAPALPPELCERMCAASLRLARAAGYVNAGTVEFIVVPDGAFYFLEMNTRLQVEHPVTEMVTGLDLVEWQLRVAQGERLPLTQEHIRWHGCAMECRVLAEDADLNPDTGSVLLLQEPQGPGIRFDNGVSNGARVSADFDSMLAKVIAHGATRELAIARLRQALNDTRMLGVTVNTDFLGRVLAHPAFLEGRIDTGFLPRHAVELRPRPWTDEERRALLAVAGAAHQHTPHNALHPVFAAMGAWRN